MTILAIETSCDETAVALVETIPRDASGFERPRILAEKIASQVSLHAQYGGVVPELAAREHLRAMPTLVAELLYENQEFMAQAPIKTVAVTVGPGLKGSLLMGVNFAKGFALANEITLVGINHIEGHLLSPLMSNPQLAFPYLGVVVSGGHTELHEVRGVGDYRLIERTCDDAAGEAFDKSAALLGIAYPGGAELSRRSAEYSLGQKKSAYRVSASLEVLSFSGLKTSFRTILEKLKRAHEPIDEGAACAAVQSAIIETILARVRTAVSISGLNKIGISGGVAANTPLKNALANCGTVFGADLRWCGDNAAMIGFVAALRFAHGLPVSSSTIRARWPVEEMSVHAR